MKIIFENGEVKEVNFNGNLFDLFLKLKLNYDEFLVSKNDEIITQDCLISNEDVLNFISVISGG